MGYPYGAAVDMWSLGCILVVCRAILQLPAMSVPGYDHLLHRAANPAHASPHTLQEMHTGVPLFNGSDETIQMAKICEVLGMPPDEYIAAASKSDTLFSRPQATGCHMPLKTDQVRCQVLFRLLLVSAASTLLSFPLPFSTDVSASACDTRDFGSSCPCLRCHPMQAVGVGPPASRPLNGVLGVSTGGPGGRRAGEAGHSVAHYRVVSAAVCGRHRPCCNRTPRTAASVWWPGPAQADANARRHSPSTRHSSWT